MKKTYEFKHHSDYMEFDFQEVADDYIWYCEPYESDGEEAPLTLKEWVKDMFSGFDDGFYYCDNRCEIIDDIVKEVSKLLENF